MILLKDLLSEKVTGVQWLSKAYKLAFDKYKIPVSPTIANILYKGKRVRAFHITSPSKLSQLNSLQGTKKSISCMTRIPDRTFSRDMISGIWQKGIIFYLEGTLMIRGDDDIMSEPDESGRRWIRFRDDYHVKWRRTVDKDPELIKLEKEYSKSNDAISDNNKLDRSEKVSQLNKAYGDFLHKKLYRYIELAESFVKANREGIIDEFINMESGDWDELVLNEIELIDAIYDNAAGSRPKVISQLKSMVSGEVVAPNPYKQSDGIDFVDNREV